MRSSISSDVPWAQNYDDFGVTTFMQTSEDWAPGSASKILSATWSGERDNVRVTHKIQFHSDQMFFTCTVTAENTGTEAISDYYYLRSVDPDQVRPP